MYNLYPKKPWLAQLGRYLLLVLALGLTRQSYAQNITTTAGDGTNTGGTPSIGIATGIAFDAAGNLYVAGGTRNYIYKVAAGSTTPTILAGNGTAGHTGDGGSATSATVNAPVDLTVYNGSLYVAETGSSYIRRIDLSTNVISTVAGDGTNTGGTPSIGIVTGVLVDGAGNVFVAGGNRHYIYKIAAGSTTPVIIAGTGTAGHTGDAGPATSATINFPVDLIGSGTDLYVAEMGSNYIRKIANVLAATSTTVTSITTATTSPTNANRLTYTVVFSGSVSGLSTANFSLSPTVTGASITGLSGSGTTYTVVVNTGSGNGSLQLNLANTTGITPAVSNTPYTGPAITIDKTSPTVTLTSDTGTSGSTTSTTPFAFTATFSESVTGFVAGDITTNGTVSGFTGNGTIYTFSVTPITGAATTVSLAASVAQDAATNGNTASNTYSLTYAVAPTVATATPANLASTSALLGGNATATGGATITSRGVVYSLTSTNAAPTLGGTGVTSDANGSGTGTYAKSISNLMPSTNYTVRAYATNGQGTSYGSALTFTTAAVLGTTGTQTNVSCNGGSNGEATVAVSGGLTPYSYAWTANGSTTSSATGLSPGTYTVTVTDASGATTSRSFNITQPAALSTTGTQTNLACNGGSTGAASVTASGGTSPYTYSWSPNVSTTTSATGLSASTYTVNVTDANGCTASYSFTLTQPSALTAVTSQNDVTTAGGNNGSASITVSGGTPDYTYSWNPNVSTTASASNLSAGTYTVTATDANGCSIARTFTISQPTAVTAAPVVTAPANGSLLSTTTPTYSGSAPAGSTVAVYVDGTSVGTTTATGGSFSLTPTMALIQGQHALYATAQLSGQTVSASSSTNTFTVDTVAPTGTVSTTAGSATSTSPIPFSVSFSETVTGFSASGLAVTNGTVTGNAMSGSGPYTFTVTPTVNGSVTVSLKANAAQDAAGNGNPASAAVSVTYTAPVTATSWTGTVSTNWFTAGNWSAGVPTATIDATIPAGVTYLPAIGSGTATTRDLTLSNGTTLTMSGGTLDVRANLTNNGTFLPTGGTVVLGTSAVPNGPSIQGSARTRFWNLSVDANGVVLNTPAGASVQRLLTLSGAFVTQSYPFVLESDATGTAMVVNVNSAGFVSGPATVQRYLDASGTTGTSGYRHYSSPVSGATVNSLSTNAYGGSFTAQVNQAYNTADPNQLTLATYPNIFSYDESKIAASPAGSFSDFDKGYQSPASLSDALTVGRGYAVQIGNAEKVQFTGSLNNGDQIITNITYAAAGTAGAASAGWALIGNPYPAPLDWRTVGTAGGSLTGIDGAAYVFQSTSAYSGRYTSFINNVGASTGLIASGQGFFVRASTPGTTASVTLTNANRLTSYASPAFQRTTAETRPLLRLSLALGSAPATAATAQDETFVYFEPGASAGFDGPYDAYKLANPSGYYLGTAAVVPTGTPELGLSIDARAPLAAGAATTVPVWLSVPAGPYTLTATDLLNFAPTGTQVYLRDALTGTLTNLATTPSYSFSVAANAPSTGRFTLLFGPNSPLATAASLALSQAVATLYPNPTATGEVTLSATGLPADVRSLRGTLTDVLGRPVATYHLPATQGVARTSLPTRGLTSGIYLLRLTPCDAQGAAVGTLPTQRLSVR